MESLLWETSWKNYILFLGSIQTEDDEDNEPPKKRVEAATFFKPSNGAEVM